jgi:transposase
MLSFSGALRIFIALDPCDMRAEINTLHALVSGRLQEEVKNGALFLVFTNKRRCRLKVLYWDGTGLWLLTKRLEAGTFYWPRAAADCQTKLALKPEAFAMLTDGIDMHGAKPRGTRHHPQRTPNPQPAGSPANHDPARRPSAQREHLPQSLTARKAAAESPQAWPDEIPVKSRSTGRRLTDTLIQHSGKNQCRCRLSVALKHLLRQFVRHHHTIHLHSVQDHRFILFPKCGDLIFPSHLCKLTYQGPHINLRATAGRQIPTEGNVEQLHLNCGKPNIKSSRNSQHVAIMNDLLNRRTIEMRHRIAAAAKETQQAR